MADLRHAFGSSLKPPVAVWRSAEAAGSMAAVPHCLFAAHVCQNNQKNMVLLHLWAQMLGCSELFYYLCTRFGPVA